MRQKLALLLSMALIAVTVSPAYARTTDKRSGRKVTAVKTLPGAMTSLGNGWVRSWIKTAAGKPIAIGLTFNEAALSGLPMEPPAGEIGFEYVMELPDAAAPFKHVLLNWNPKGHPPHNVYDMGHFDFHFYTISSQERAAISIEGEGMARCQRQPAAEFVPTDYVYAPHSEEPRMGSHWFDQRSHEFHGHKFTSTFVYGSHDGQFIFYEPMITKSFLETKTLLNEAIKLPSRYAQPGYYPTRYSVNYDAQAKTHSVSLEGLVWR